MQSEEKEFQRVIKERDSKIEEMTQYCTAKDKRIELLEIKVKTIQMTKSAEHRREIDRLTRERNIIVRMAHDEVDCNLRLQKVDKSTQTMD